jgi:putative salt-induced outer membrane protein YdiY
MLSKKLLLLLVLVFVGSAAHADDEPWVDGFVPAPSAYTWIQLTSDEWLKGEVITIYNETLTFDSDNLGELRLDLEDVRHLIGYGSFEVTSLGRAPIGGELRISDQQVVITAAGETYQVPRTDLIAITPLADREIDRWSGDIGFGLNVRRGNSDISEGNLMVGFKRRTPVSRLIFDYLGSVNETEGHRIANSHRANLGLDRFSGERFFWRPIGVQYYQDAFQNIRHQATVDTGIGYQMIDSPRVEWDIQGGVGVNYLRNVSVADGKSIDEVSPAVTLGSDLTVELTSWIDYELFINMTFLNEESGEYQHHIVSTVSTDVIKNVDLDVSFIWERTQKPQERVDTTIPEKDDVRLLVSIGYDF